jgi:hypothetical protein
MGQNVGEKMAKNTKNQVATVSLSRLTAEELKSAVRDALVSMGLAEREEFIKVLSEELKRVGLNIRMYLVPLGIPGRKPDDLTPTEVGHLIRFLKINVPKAMPAVAAALSRFGILAERANQPGNRLAA